VHAALRVLAASSAQLTPEDRSLEETLARLATVARAMRARGSEVAAERRR
jgi:hypothetical protein